MRCFVFSLAITAMCVLSVSVGSAQPTMVSYQGALLKNGGTFHGDAEFKFAILCGGAIVWNSDNGSPQNGDPTASVTITVDNGVFSVMLGDTGEGMPSLTSALLDGCTMPLLRLWVDTGGGFEQLLSDQPFGSSAFSIKSDLANMTTSGGGSGNWNELSGNVYRLTGNVGIGTDIPEQALEIERDHAAIRVQDDDDPGSYTEIQDSSPTQMSVKKVSSSGDAMIELDPRTMDGAGGATVRLFRSTLTTGARRLIIGRGDGTAAISAEISAAGRNSYFQADGGNLGIGSSIASARLHVHADQSDAGPWVQFEGGGTIFENTSLRLYDRGSGSGNRNIVEFAHSNAGTPTPGSRMISESVGTNVSSGAKLILETASNSTGTFNSNQLVLDRDGDVGIGTASPQSMLDVNGTTKTCILKIDGGCDISEPFLLSTSEASVDKGSVLVIDESHPGYLKLSNHAYDTRVAGVVSGANGLNPGLTLSQRGVFEDGQNVALSGRVYVLATTMNGTIVPGDLLTTSGVPGHAMKATDRERRAGTIIGKAMSELTEGQGYVLVLVSLQ